LTRATVIGAAGFVGSAFLEHLRALAGTEVVAVTRDSYEQHRGRASDVVVDCAGNSRKYLAEKDPIEDMARTVEHRLRTLRDFPAGLQVHISSVDVYDRLDSPLTTREETALRPQAASHYGFHKRLAEMLVQHYAPDWLILRLGGMVGPGLRKNPVHDVLSGSPLWVHPDSQYQFLETKDVARIAWLLVSAGHRKETFNVCGEGLVSPREVARLADRALDPEAASHQGTPRIVHVSLEKLRRHVSVPGTLDAIRSFLREGGSLSRARTGRPTA
jgi:nucleoside-diphosphate-sugar epimerase